MAQEYCDGVKMGFTRELVIESKLILLVKEGGLLRIPQRGWKRENTLLLGPIIVKWLGGAVEECLSGEKKDFYTANREGYQSFIA